SVPSVILSIWPGLIRLGSAEDRTVVIANSRWPCCSIHMPRSETVSTTRTSPLNRCPTWALGFARIVGIVTAPIPVPGAGTAAGGTCRPVSTSSTPVTRGSSVSTISAMAQINSASTSNPMIHGQMEGPPRSDGSLCWTRTSAIPPAPLPWRAPSACARPWRGPRRPQQHASHVHLDGATIRPQSGTLVRRRGRGERSTRRCATAPLRPRGVVVARRRSIRSGPGGVGAARRTRINGGASMGNSGGGGTGARLRVFVTGATGYVGSAIVREFVRAGYEVTGMTRWAERADDLEALGARAVVGDLRDPLSYRDVAARYDVLIHVAAEPSTARARLDAAAVDTLLSAARRRAEERAERGAEDEPVPMLIYTSGVWSLGRTGMEPADESRPPDTGFELVAWRAECEQKVLEAAGPDLATAVVRPGIVYGGRGGILAEFFVTAARDGAAAYVGNGENRWSLVYRGDNARLYRLIAESRA